MGKTRVNAVEVHESTERRCFVRLDRRVESAVRLVCEVDARAAAARTRSRRPVRRPPAVRPAGNPSFECWTDPLYSGSAKGPLMARAGRTLDLAIGEATEKADPGAPERPPPGSPTANRWAPSMGKRAWLGLVHPICFGWVS